MFGIVLDKRLCRFTCLFESIRVILLVIGVLMLSYFISQQSFWKTQCYTSKLYLLITIPLFSRHVGKGRAKQNQLFSVSIRARCKKNKKKRKEVVTLM